MLHLREKIEKTQEETFSQLGFKAGDEKSKRLYALLSSMGCDSPFLPALIERVLTQHPDLTMPDLVAIVLDWNKSENNHEQKPSRPVRKSKKVLHKDWHTLDSDDLRFKFSQTSEQDIYRELKKSAVIFDIDSWLRNVS